MLRIDEGSGDILIDSGRSMAQFARSGFTSLLSEPLLALKPGSVSRRAMRGVEEHEGRAFLRAEPFEGAILSGLIADAELAIPALALIAESVIGSGVPLAELGSVDPSFAMVGADSALLPSRRLSAKLVAPDFALHDPALSGEAEIAFSLAFLAYRSLSGQDPYDATDMEALLDARRNSFLVPLHRVDPAIAPELAAVVEGALLDPSAAGLAEFAKALRSAATGGIRPPAPEAELASRIQAAEARLVAKEKRKGSRAFRKRNRTRFIIAGAAIAAVAVFVGSLLFKESRFALLPSLAPDKVALAYYEALDAMDMEMMRRVSLPGAVDADVRLVEAIWPASRGAIAYGGKLAFLGAKDWIALKRPPQAGMVFGVHDLQLKPKRVGKADYIFDAEYDYVVTDTGNMAKPKSINEYARADELWLKKTDAGWKIYRIRRNQAPVAGS